MLFYTIFTVGDPWSGLLAGRVLLLDHCPEVPLRKWRTDSWHCSLWCSAATSVGTYKAVLCMLL